VPSQVAIDHGLAFRPYDPDYLESYIDELRSPREVKRIVPDLATYRKLESLTLDELKSRFGGVLDAKSIEGVNVRVNLLRMRVKELGLFPGQI
jgi:hypothetical protein